MLDIAQNAFAMKKMFFFLSFAACLTACQQEKSETTQQTAATQIWYEADKTLEYKNLKLLPLLASQEFIRDRAAAAELLPLKDAIETPRFRITEKKPFGRFDDHNAVNTLTVQNKSEFPVFLMSGDIVQGGRQDRVIAADAVVMPRTIQDVPVFCVEPHRWDYAPQEEPEATDKNEKKVYAFKGYYNVASNEIRKTLAQQEGQDAVWEKVSQIRARYNVNSPTGAYADLEKSESFTQLRDAYLNYFSQKLENTEQVVGLIAISGDQILGTDIFAHPHLFQRQYESLLHSYITDALRTEATGSMSASAIAAYAQKVLNRFEAEKSAASQYKGIALHFSDL